MKLILGLLAVESSSLRLSKSYDIPDCRENYRGNANQSMYGENCLRWDNLSTRNEFHPMNQRGKGLESNYCRNPDGKDGGPWCFVSFYDPIKGTPPKFSYCEVECPNTKGPIASDEFYGPLVTGLPKSSIPPMAMGMDPMAMNNNLESTTLDFYSGSTVHITNSMDLMTEDLFAGSPSTSPSTTLSTTTTSATTTTTTTTTTTSRQRRTRPTRRTRLTRPPTSTATEMTTSTSTTTTTTSRSTDRIKTIRPTRRTRPSTTRRRRTTTSSTTTTTTTTRRRRTRPTQPARSTEKGPTKDETWILPEVDGQKIEISDLEIDSSLEEYLYTTLPNPTFINALDTLRDWAANRKVEAVELPRIDVRSSLGNLMQGMNSILKTDKHKK